MTLNQFDAGTTRRLALGLLGASGALLFTVLNLCGAAIIGDKVEFAVLLSASVSPLVMSTAFGFIALVFAEIADHPSTPEQGHPHSKPNYLQSAFVFLAVAGLGALLLGAFRAISAITIKAV